MSNVAGSSLSFICGFFLLPSISSYPVLPLKRAARLSITLQRAVRASFRTIIFFPFISENVEPDLIIPYPNDVEGGKKTNKSRLPSTYRSAVGLSRLNRD